MSVQNSMAIIVEILAMLFKSIIVGPYVDTTWVLTVFSAVNLELFSC